MVQTIAGKGRVSVITGKGMVNAGELLVSHKRERP